MTKLIDLAGQKFGKLTVIKLYSKKPTKWLCKCICGVETVVDTRNLISGHTKSCGCSRHKTPSNATHKLRQHKLYNVWNGIKQRCNNPNNNRYKDYGGRGISICKEWNDNFKSFYDWAYANGYNENAEYGKCTIDRINVNGNYEPNNCRWIDIKTQSNNRRNNHLITYNGEAKTIAEWSRILNIKRTTILERLNKKWEISKVFTNML